MEVTPDMVEYIQYGPQVTWVTDTDGADERGVFIRQISTGIGFRRRGAFEAAGEGLFKNQPIN